MSTLVLPVTENDHHVHAVSARHALVEYGDFGSPDSGAGYHVVKELLRDLGEDLCYVYRHFPREDVHPHAQLAAEAAEAADMQGKFWLMHDRLFEHQSEISPALVRHLARELPLDVHHFEEDLASGEPRRRVEASRAEGLGAGVETTPTFFVNGRLQVGSYEYAPLFTALTGTEPES